MTQLKRTYDDVVLFTHDSASVAATLKAAIAAGANLRGVNLQGADLRGVNLQGVNLQGANLRDLQYANLQGANLRDADLQYANLQGVNLRGADLRDVNLRGAKGLDTFVIAVEGILIGYKKLANGKIATLRIPAKAKRVNAYGSRKCRAEYAVVISGSGPSQHNRAFLYAKGKKVVPDSYDPDPRIECSHGVHFFITKSEAEAY
jgi:hypothetical protein